MKVLFIIPPEDHYLGASAHESVDRKREHRPKLGILYVASFIRKYRPDIVVKVIDCPSCGIGYDGIEKILIHEQPDIVGLTSLTFTYLDALKTAQLIKKALPLTKVCVGGIHATLYPEETLAQSCFDYVVIGEGEVVFLELLSQLEKKEPLSDVRGLGFKDDGQVVLNKPAESVCALDELPFPDYTLTEMKQYSHVLGVGNITLSIQTSRGCPFACTFCDIRRTRWRYRSAESVVLELEKWVCLGIRSFFFIDDNFVLIKKRVIEICKLIIQRKWNIDFKISSRVDTLDEEMLLYLKNAGCARISLGIESGHQKFLDYLQKGISVEQIVNAVKMARKIGIPVFAYMIIGFPGETWDEMREELKFVKILGVKYASFSLLTAYPGTDLYKREREQRIISSDVWREYAIDPRADFLVPLVNKIYSEVQLRKFQRQLMASFYLSWKNMLNTIMEIRSFEQLARYVKIGYNILLRK